MLLIYFSASFITLQLFWVNLHWFKKTTHIRVYAAVGVLCLTLLLCSGLSAACCCRRTNVFLKRCSITNWPLGVGQHWHVSKPKIRVSFCVSGCLWCHSLLIISEMKFRNRMSIMAQFQSWMRHGSFGGPYSAWRWNHEIQSHSRVLACEMRDRLLLYQGHFMREGKADSRLFKLIRYLQMSF